MNSRRCGAYAGSDPCILEAGHDEDHATHWGEHVIMRGRGDEPWAHDYGPLTA